MSGTIPVTLVVLTFNEEPNLAACLSSVDGLVDEIFVVDSGSTDATFDIAHQAGAKVVDHPFVTHAEQWDWALSNLPISNDWVLGLDADQRLSPPLASELRALFGGGDGSGSAQLRSVDGFYLNRRQIFRGRWIRHGGYYPKYLLKLFRRDAVRLDPAERLDHHFYVDRAAKLRHDLIEENKKEDVIAFWLDKHVRYAGLVADEAVSRTAAAARPERTSAASWRDPAYRSLLMKRAFSRMPRYWRAFGFFAYRYFLRGGFLDGREGFVFHFLQTCWFRVVVDVMIDERAGGSAGHRQPGAP